MRSERGNPVPNAEAICRAGKSALPRAAVRYPSHWPMPSARLKAKPKLVAPGSTTTETENAFVPRTPQTFWHDLDANLLRDGRWTNKWDGENRLIAMESLASAPTGSKLKLEFEYEHMGSGFRSKAIPGTARPICCARNGGFLSTDAI